MIDPIRLALNQQILINLATIVFIVTCTEIVAATIADQTKLFSEQNEGTWFIECILYLFCILIFSLFGFCLLGAWE